MTNFFRLIVAFWDAIFNLLSEVQFSLYSYQVNLLDIMFVFLVLSMIISLFWKGGRG